MPVGQAQMPLFDHLNELRRRLTIVLVALTAATIGLYLIAPQLIWFLISPIAEYIRLDSGPIETLEDLRGLLVVFGAFDGFTLQFKVALVFGFLVTSPIWIWQILGFFLPALLPSERKWVVPTFFAAVLLFATGMVFCYFVILNPAFEWLLGQSIRFATIVADAQEFINTILLFEVAFGIAFELPLIVFYLVAFEIIPYKTLRSNWRAIYIVLMVICAMVTPDASPITMLLMFAAMLVLYEGSLLLSRIVLGRRLSRQRLEASEDEPDDED